MTGYVGPGEHFLVVGALILCRRNGTNLLAGHKIGPSDAWFLLRLNQDRIVSLQIIKILQGMNKNGGFLILS